MVGGSVSLSGYSKSGPAADSAVVLVWAPLKAIKEKLFRHIYVRHFVYEALTDNVISAKMEN